MGLEQGARYVLTAPDGTVAVFNDPTSADFVGYLTDPPSGLEGAETRGNTDPNVEGPGGNHGDRYDSFLVPTLTGIIPPDDGVAVVNDRIERIQWATRAMQADGVLSWQETGEPYSRMVRRLRRQQPPRFGGRRPKTFQLQMVSDEHRVVSGSDLNGGSAPANSEPGVTVTNDGNDGPVRIVWELGASVASNIRVRNHTTNLVLGFNGTFTGTVTIDLANRTIRDAGGDRYGTFNFLGGPWWQLANGPNRIRVTDANLLTAAFTVYHRHGWA